MSPAAQVTTGPQHPREFSQHRLEAGHVDQGQRADDDVRRVIRERQPVQPGHAEIAVRDALSRPAEHVRRAVDADDLMPAPGEELGEPPGPAGGVQGHAGLAAGQALGHHRLIESEQAAARVGVIAGPAARRRRWC